VRLFNRKWIEGMMREGYAGADQISVHVANSLGWTTMRQGSVGEDYWTEIVDTFIRDKKNLQIKEWFESENPFAYQDLTETLLETIRKGYWQPDTDTIREIAEEYARSVVLHGEGGGLRGGGNFKLEAFVQQVLAEANDRDLNELLTQLTQKAAESTQLAGATIDSPAPTLAQSQPTLSADTQSPTAEPEASKGNPDANDAPEVSGKVLEPIAEPSIPTDAETDEEPATSNVPWRLIAVLAILLLISVGYVLRWGNAKS